jgi:hypothetical protein
MNELAPGVNLEQRGEWSIVHIDYWADPRKRDPEWAVRMRARLGEQRFRREILRDWTVAAGEPYFLEVSNDPMGYVYEVPHLMDAPIYVGLDFGRRHPAAVWLQYDKKADRVFVLREWMPSQIDAYSFRDVVLWLSGERTYAALPAYAQGWADRLTRDPSFPQTPFFPQRSQANELRYWAGHEANMERAEVAAETEERSTADIWRAAGIQLGVYAVAVAARELALRKLLAKRDDKWPGLLFSPTCRILITGFAGGITFAKGTKANPMPDRAARDGYYENILDALGYAVVNISDFRGPMQPQPERAAPVAPRKGAYERAVDAPPDPHSLNVKETRRSVWSPFRKPY